MTASAPIVKIIVLAAIAVLIASAAWRAGRASGCFDYEAIPYDAERIERKQ